MRAEGGGAWPGWMVVPQKTSGPCVRRKLAGGIYSVGRRRVVGPNMGLQPGTNVAPPKAPRLISETRRVSTLPNLVVTSDRLYVIEELVQHISVLTPLMYLCN